MKGVVDRIFPILRKVQALQEAMDITNARENMIATVEQVFRLITILYANNDCRKEKDNCKQNGEIRKK